MEILELIPSILNHLTPAEERVYLRLWARTHAVGHTTCRATFENLARECGLSWSTTKTALVKLEGRGLVEIERFHKAPCVFSVQCIALVSSDQPVAFGTSQTLDLLTEGPTEKCYGR